MNGNAPAKGKYIVRRKIFGDGRTGDSEMQLGEERPVRATAAVE